ncbi:LysM repeat protein [Dyadobacter jejuensis]|uniref:LysM repeat protein n=1 Tax=Dyadobacter jejuensis TaxID=1082580 RepID=A0A316B4G0_9BACT|nr:LysM peptidoglycan-binding domain-containing protein [Dyadobacter jejuensis]PWJ57487.1 LysM repeat protein [Dyadobacter jejuensis]
MKYIIILALCVGGLLKFSDSEASKNHLAVVDSVGFEKVGGKSFILHKVDPGQTMFAVVRRYGTTIHLLREANPGVPDNIQAGQILRVPYTYKAAGKDRKVEVVTESKSVPTPTGAAPTGAASTAAASTGAAPTAAASVSEAPNGVHRVEAGQTLYRVAVKFGVLMADIRKWNNLTDDNLKEGQMLVVKDPNASKETPASAAPAKVVTTVVKDSVKAKTVVPEKTVKPVETVAAPKVVSGKKKSESGLAEVIETDESTSKFLGLHRTAPIGALVEVLNEYNQERIIVRIIGRIPDTSINDEIVIKLSSRAFEKVSPNSKRFRAVVSYIE